MKLLRTGPVGRERPAFVADDGKIRDLSVIGGDIDGAFFASGGLRRAAQAAQDGACPVIGEVDQGRVRLQGGGRVGPPVARPGKVVCIGLNYRDHAAETGAQIPSEPILFMKASNTVVGPYDDILVPRASTKTDWEVELAVVIGHTARYLGSPDDAMATVAGFTLSNDVSEREFQLERGGQWDKGKCCETFNPMGPWVQTVDEVTTPQGIGLRCRVNGVTRQDGNTADMVFGVAHLIWYVSQFMVLDPGDVINTGTPAGVALGSAGVPFLGAGDQVEIEGDGLGIQSCAVAQA
jgi:2-keto-4-pentenoate hydratase/2-oxohepta-3-ene-1,7-dioic acid hydratase in catechol pathway